MIWHKNKAQIHPIKAKHISNIFRQTIVIMKFAVVLLVLLPLALGASIDEKRFIEQLLGGYDGK